MQDERDQTNTKFTLIFAILLVCTSTLVRSEEPEIEAIRIDHIANRIQGGIRVSYTVTNPTNSDFCIPSFALNDNQTRSIGMFRAFDKNGDEILLPSEGMPCYAVSKDFCGPIPAIKLAPSEHLESSFAIPSDYFDVGWAYYIGSDSTAYTGTDIFGISDVHLFIRAVTRCDLMDSEGNLPTQVSWPFTDAYDEANWIKLISPETSFTQTD